MAKLLSFMKRGGTGREVEATLLRLDRGKLTVRMEIERTLIRFNTRIAVKRNAIVVAKPPALGGELATGGFVRFKLPDNPARELRMEVVTPHFNLTNNQPVFLCKPPTAFCETSQRKSERFDTTKFNNLRLELPGHAEPFRIVDISQRGCRIMTDFARPREHLPPSEAIGDGSIQLGKHVRLNLAAVVPRAYQGKSVGLGFSLDPGGDNAKLLHHLLQSLNKKEGEVLQAEAL